MYQCKAANCEYWGSIDQLAEHFRTCHAKKFSCATCKKKNFDFEYDYVNHVNMCRVLNLAVQHLDEGFSECGQRLETCISDCSGVDTCNDSTKQCSSLLTGRIFSSGTAVVVGSDSTMRRSSLEVTCARPYPLESRKRRLNFGPALNKISSAISGSSKAKDSHQQTPPSDPHTIMSGNPPNNPYLPTQNPQNQWYAGYPPNQPPTSGYPSYVGAPYPGIGGPGYAPQSQPYAGAGHPSGTGGAYQPNVGYGQPGVGSGYGAPSFPPTSGYPQQTPQSGGGYPGQRPTSGNMYQSGGTATIKPNPNFNAKNSAETLLEAMQGFRCDQNKVVQALCVCNYWQRQEVIKQFRGEYGLDLIIELKTRLSGDFEDLIMALMETHARYDAQQLHKAMAGIGTKESVLIEIMTTRSNAQVQELKYTYKQLYGKDLEHDLVGETSGHFKRLLVSLCAAGRDESWNVDPLRANQDARALYRAGEQRLGTDETTFNAILASQNFHQLRMVFDEYQNVSDHTIEHAIQAEFSSDISDVRDGLLAIVKSIRNRVAYFAELIYNSMKGLGTRDTDLIRLIVTRSEIDLADIRNQYQAQYRTSLEKAIAGHCSGAYKEGLIALVKGN
ncbi:annexin domain-containing protein [Ditylenchus destructor]|nr:annexin domain-containing protein [Ditylenchus destructor]